MFQIPDKREKQKIIFQKKFFKNFWLPIPISRYFSCNYRHRLVLKIRFPDHIFPKISKYHTENPYFPSTGKYYAPQKKEKKGINVINWFFCILTQIRASQKLLQ